MNRCRDTRARYLAVCAKLASNGIASDFGDKDCKARYNPALHSSVFRANAGLPAWRLRTQDGNAADRDLRRAEPGYRDWPTLVALQSKRSGRDPHAAGQSAKAPNARGKILPNSQENSIGSLAFARPQCFSGYKSAGQQQPKGFRESCGSFRAANAATTHKTTATMAAM